MNRTILMSVLFAGLAVVFYACKNDTESAPTGTGVISGTVTDSSSGAPLAGVTVTAQTASLGTQSSFSFTTDSAKSVTLTFSKSGFRTRTVVAEASSGNVTSLSVAMNSSTPITGGTGTGVAATIGFVGSDPQEVAVYGVGGVETAYLRWEVRDSVGLPIDAAHAVTLSFRISNGPGGGEYLSPVNVTTNAQGRGTHAFNSGIRSGVAQVVASTVVNGRTLASTPVRVIIRAGLPDQTHFTVAPEKHNWPTLGIAGNRLAISVLVGDKYTNNVQENTAVYFSTSAGVIQASTYTSSSGEGTVSLISGNPAPFGQHASLQYGDGYHYTVAQTIGENAVTVKDSTLILWSGRSQVSNISPASVNISNGGAQTVQFRVSDALGHPLSGGTTISVNGSGTPYAISVFFGNNGSVTLDDILFPGPGATDFSFTVSDAFAPDSLSRVNVSISVTGPNGVAFANVGGFCR
jgi:hypothetical protein